VAHVRGGGARSRALGVPRLQGHSFQDTQAYKTKDVVDAEWARDPLPKLKAHVVPSLMSETEWDAAQEGARRPRRRARRSLISGR
jgi:2-oxoisovalerate dehydrogenase E1 component